MKIKFIKIKGYKNLDFEMKFPDDGVAVFIGNNGSGKSNILEAISLIFGYYHKFILSNSNKQSLKDIKFEYEIDYEIDSNFIVLKNKKIFLNEQEIKFEKKYFPNKIYAVYSGEDLKLWQNFYFPFYESYIKKVKNMKLDDLPFIYINKYFWDIAILMLFLFDRNLKDLNLGNLKEIKFTFNKNLFKRNIKNNKIVSFVKKISKNQEQQSFNFQKFKDLYDYELRNINLNEKEQQQEFFELLFSAYLPDKKLKTFKFIDEIKLDFDNNLNFLDLSEGEKKLILLRLLFNILLDEKSILLLDEPDDNIHPANKVQIKKLLDNCSLQEKNVIITTHSPTLTHLFKSDNIFMIDNGNIINKDKKEIIEFLTDKNWTYQDINIVLSSDKDIFLVEGKTDELFLQTALEIFQKEEKFRSLNFNYIPVGGASGMKLFLEKFKTNSDRKVFALLDADYAGSKSLKEFLTTEKLRKLKNEKIFIENDFILIYLPKPDFVKQDEYEIEDLFPNEIKRELAKKGWEKKSEKWQGTIKTIPKIDKDSLKKDIEQEVKKFKEHKKSLITKESFKEFKKIFELIEKIKNEPN